MHRLAFNPTVIVPINRIYPCRVPIYDLGGLGGAEPDTFYARVSFQVFNEISDAQFLATAVSTLVQESK